MKFKHQFILDRADKHTRLYRSDGILMRIDFIEDILRVALIKNEDLLPTFSIDPAHQGTGIRGSCPWMALNSVHRKSMKIMKNYVSDIAAMTLPSTCSIFISPSQMTRASFMKTAAA